MYTFYYLVLVVTAVTGAVIDDSETAVINGELASILDYPFYVSLRFKVQKSVLCGGSIVGPDVVLTAAHCIGPEFQVYVGISDDNNLEGAEVYDVKKIVKHSLYMGMPFCDIALVKLNRSIILSEKAEIAKLATKNPPEDEEVAIIGFGKTVCDVFDDPKKQCRNALSDHLRYAAMTVTDVTFGMISSSGQDQNACFGDSGGPMIYDGKIVGVGSRVDNNDCSGGNTYTSVATNKRWIRKNLKKLARI